MEKELISIVTPVYNAASFIEDTIKTVLNQTYQNWELLLIDDQSQDDSAKIIKEYIKKDKRIKYFKQEKNGGAAKARNRGINESRGRYLCFLDSDDLWEKEKLKKQIQFIKEKNCEFSYTGYEFADETGKPNGNKVFVPSTINYTQALKNTTIWTSTVMFDMTKMTKEMIQMPDVRRGQDTATWWKVLKKIECAYGLNEILSYYRRTNNSLSSNKLKALKRTWYLYRKVEGLNFIKSIYYFNWYMFNAIKRRI